jgi:hypothetical protein
VSSVSAYWLLSDVLLRLACWLPLDPVPAMANDTHRVLWCLIKGESIPFEVIAPANASIYQLKKLIRVEKENGALQDVDAANLMLGKVSSEEVTDNSQLTSYS